MKDKIKKLLEEEGFKLVSDGYSNGEEISHYLNKEGFLISISFEDPDEEIIADILGVEIDKVESELKKL